MADKEKKEEKKCGGEGEGNDYKFSMLPIEHGGKCFIVLYLVLSEPS